MIFTKFKDMAVDTPYDVSIEWKPKGSKTTNIIDLPGGLYPEKASCLIRYSYMVPQGLSSLYH